MFSCENDVGNMFIKRQIHTHLLVAIRFSPFFSSFTVAHSLVMAICCHFRRIACAVLNTGIDCAFFAARRNAERGKWIFGRAP